MTADRHGNPASKPFPPREQVIRPFKGSPLSKSRRKFRVIGFRKSLPVEENFFGIRIQQRASQTDTTIAAVLARWAYCRSPPHPVRQSPRLDFRWLRVIRTVHRASVRAARYFDTNTGNIHRSVGRYCNQHHASRLGYRRAGRRNSSRLHWAKAHDALFGAVLWHVHRPNCSQY